MEVVQEIDLAELHFEAYGVGLPTENALADLLQMFIDKELESILALENELAERKESLKLLMQKIKELSD